MAVNEKSMWLGKKILRALPLYFEANVIRELEVPEELKKKLSRMYREAEAFMQEENFGRFLEKLYLMAVFYRDKVRPLVTSAADSSQKAVVRLHFLLWYQLQHYILQFSIFAEPKSYFRVVTEANDALFQIGQEWLRLNGIPFEVKMLEERDESDTIQEYPAIIFIERDSSLPGKITSQLLRSGAHPHMLAYSPAYTGPGNWAGKLTERTLYVSAKFVIGLCLDPDTGHELFHWRQRIIEHSFQDDVFHGDVTRTAERPFPESAGSYQGGFNFDELPAHAYSVATRIERLRRAESDKVAQTEATATFMDSQPGRGLANAMGVVVSDALSTLQKIFETHDIETPHFDVRKLIGNSSFSNGFRRS